MHLPALGTWLVHLWLWLGILQLKLVLKVNELGQLGEDTQDMKRFIGKNIPVGVIVGYIVGSSVGYSVGRPVGVSKKLTEKEIYSARMVYEMAIQIEH